MKNMKWIFLICVILSLTACLPNDGTHNTNHLAGFFWGIWHGWIAPVSLIISIFKPQISIYESNNIGLWYNFGFYIAIIGGFGSLQLTRNKYKTSNCSDK